MAEHKFRNRIIASIVYALLTGGTVYGYIRSNGLEAEIVRATVADSARSDSIVGLIVKRDSLLDILAVPPDTVVLEKIVRVYVPPDTVVDIRVDTITPPAVTVTDTVLLTDTLRMTVPGPIRIETVEVHRANWTERIIIGAAGFLVGYGVRTIGWNGSTTTVHDHHDHIVVDSVHRHHEHEEDDDNDH